MTENSAPREEMKYNVTGQVKTLEEGIPLEQVFSTLDGVPLHPVEATFPILQQTKTLPWKPIGTGFFISTNGLFATAKHVLTDETGQLLEFLIGIQLSRGKQSFSIREIINVTLHESADVAIGFLLDEPLFETGEQTLNYAFTLTENMPREGDKVFSVAIPGPESFLLEKEGAFELNFVPRLIEGVLEEHFPNGRDRIFLPSHCFRTSMEIDGGASGGPVFYGNGSAFAINSTGFDGVPVSHVSSITDLLDLTVRNVVIGMDDGNQVRDEMTIRELAAYKFIRIVEQA